MEQPNINSENAKSRNRQKEDKMKIREITDRIAEFAPLELAESWDNPGLMLGSLGNECTGVVVALDLTVEVVEQAIENGCNLIVTHHPFFFVPVKRIDTDEARGRIVSTLMKHDITVYSAHTNLDVCENGLCSALAKKIGGYDLQPNGVGVICNINETTLSQFAREVADVLGDGSVRFVGEGGETLHKAFCICGGGGSNSAYAFAKSVADVFVTGDLKHNIYIDAQNDGFPIVEFSHYHSEIIVLDLFEHILADCGVKIIKANQNCPFRVVGGQNGI